MERKLPIALGVFVLAFLLPFLMTRKEQNHTASKDAHPYPELMQQEFFSNYGQRITLKSLGTGYKLVFFGSIYGSDVSTLALENLSEIQSYRFRYPLTTIFVTLDPERDTEELIRKTLALYGGSILSLRGSPESIYNLAEKFGVRWKKVEIPGSRLEYGMDSSPWMYLTTPDYRILGAYPSQIRKERLRLEVEAQMKRNPPLP